MYNVGQKVLVRVMDCTSKEFDQWEVTYKTGVIAQENILRADKEVLYTVKLSNGDCEHVWTKHILEFPKEWVDR